MRFLILIPFLACSLWAEDRFTESLTELKDGSPGLFFDAHNHTSGVLSPLQAINPKKFISGQTVTGADMQSFWFKFLNYYNSITCNEETGKCKTTKLKSGPTLSNGAKDLLNCNEPAFYCTEDKPADRLCTISLVRNIYNLLSATPLNSFAGAYAARRVLPKIPDLEIATIKEQKQATVLALAMAGVGLVEMSQTFINENNVYTLLDYQKLIDDLKSPKTSLENRALKNRFTTLGLKVPTIKWLLTTNTKSLGKVSENSTASYQNGSCKVVEEPPIVPMAALADDEDTDIEPDIYQGIYKTLIKYPNTVGVDVAGPEYTCFTKAGMNEFKKLANATLQASKVRNRLGKKGVLVVRAHVGEGVPIEDAEPIITAKASERKESCKATQNFPSYKKNAQGQYVHEVEVRKNISRLIDTIKELKASNPDINKFVVFRLGHVAHLTNDQARAMKILGITADVNLSSNIATNASNVDPLIIEKYLVDKNVSPSHTTNLLTALKGNGASYEEIFKDHGLKYLLANKVPVMLGTDGSGVEHSPTLKREYEIANDLINAWNKNPVFRNLRVSIDDIFKAQAEHFKKMGY